MSPPVPSLMRLAARAIERPAEVVVDDRDTLEPGESALLIVEDDPNYARILVEAPESAQVKRRDATRRLKLVQEQRAAWQKW